MSLLRPTMLLNIAAKTASIRAAPIMATRFYTVSASDAQTRVLDVVKGFEKVDPSKVKSSVVCTHKYQHTKLFCLGYC